MRRGDVREVDEGIVRAWFDEEYGLAGIWGSYGCIRSGYGYEIDGISQVHAKHPEITVTAYMFASGSEY